jgi:hypothetical protein
MAIESLLSRRNVVLGLAGTAAAGTVAVQKTGGADALASLLRPAEEGNGSVLLAKATAADWALQIGTIFTAHTGHILKLVDVQNFPKSARPKGMRNRAFVARFDIVKGGKMAGDKIYRVNHQQGAFDLFLSGANPAKPKRMKAVFG